MKMTIQARVLVKSLSLSAALGVMSCGTASTNVSSDSTSEASGALASPELLAAQTAWGEAMAATPSEDEGCFRATYPSAKWEAVACAEAPTHFNIRPALASNGIHNNTVGNGNDYAAVSAGLTSKAIGTFPTVAGVKTETDSGASNEYSIQLNSNFMSGIAACKGVSGCQSWSQFVYSSSEQSAFIQDWLIGIGTCPSSAWNDDGSGDCYKNSAAVSVPKIAITSLSTFKMSGAATKSKDSLVFTAAGKAYSTSQADSVTNLSTAWNASEFNIVGDGGGSAAVFNKGASVTVKLALTDGSTSAPSCVTNDGTTGETNDLTAGNCTAAGGSSPYIEFTEAR